MAKKKICFLVGYFPFFRGGAEFQSYLLAKELEKDFDIFFISSTFPKENVYYDNGFKIYTLKPLKLPKMQSVYIFQYKKIFHILEKEKPDYIYHRALNANIYAAADYCKAFNAKLFWHIAIIKDLYVDKIAINQNFITNFFESRLMLKGILRADIIFAQTNEQKKILHDRFGRDAIQVYNFHAEPAGNCIKDSGEISVLWVANLKKKKQPYLFIHIAKAFADYTNVKFIMMGRPGGGRYSAKSIRKKIEGDSNISYVGEVPIYKVNEYFEKSHILINTSKYEGFSNTYVQAFMHKVPVITLCSDPDNILEKHHIGFKTDSIHKTIETLKYLIERPEMIAEMGTLAHRFAVENLGMSNIGKLKREFERLS